MNLILNFLREYALEIVMAGWGIALIFFVAKETYWWWIGRKGFVITLNNEDLKRGEYLETSHGVTVLITMVVLPGVYKVILMN